MNKKKKKKKSDDNKLKESKGLTDGKGKTIEPTQAEDSFALVSNFFSKILTTQQLNNLKKIHNVYEELESRGAGMKIAKSLELQYGSISLAVVAHEKKLIAGWSNRLTKLRALKQRHQADATRKEIIAKFQKALTKKKVKCRKEKSKKRLNQKPKKLLGKKPNEEKIQKVYKELEEESRPKILDFNELVVLRISKMLVVKEVKGNMDTNRVENIKGKFWLRKIEDKGYTSQAIYEGIKESWKKRKKKKKETNQKTYEITRKKESYKDEANQKIHEVKAELKKRKRKLQLQE